MRNINIWNGTPLGYNKEYDDVNLGLPRLDEFAINDGKKHPCILIIPGGRTVILHFFLAILL